MSIAAGHRPRGFTSVRSDPHRLLYWPAVGIAAPIHADGTLSDIQSRATARLAALALDEQVMIGFYSSADDSACSERMLMHVCAVKPSEPCYGREIPGLPPEDLDWAARRCRFHLCPPGRAPGWDEARRRGQLLPGAARATWASRVAHDIDRGVGVGDCR
jgi:hypothetical protein